MDKMIEITSGTPDRIPKKVVEAIRGIHGFLNILETNCSEDFLALSLALASQYQHMVEDHNVSLEEKTRMVLGDVVVTMQGLKFDNDKEDIEELMKTEVDGALH